MFESIKKYLQVLLELLNLQPLRNALSVKPETKHAG